VQAPDACVRVQCRHQVHAWARVRVSECVPSDSPSLEAHGRDTNQPHAHGNWPGIPARVSGVHVMRCACHEERVHVMGSAIWAAIARPGCRWMCPGRNMRASGISRVLWECET